MKSASFSHENLGRERPVKPPSEKNFGAVMTAAFLIFGILGLFKGTHLAPYFLAASLIFLGLTFLAPRLLYWPNLAWFKFGVFLHLIINPIILSILFFVVLVPFGVFFRILGIIRMRKHRDPTLDTYWVERSDHRYREGGFVDQF